MVRLYAVATCCVLFLLVAGSESSTSRQKNSVESDSSRPRVQFAGTMNMTAVLEEGRMLFQLQVPSFIEGDYYKNISIAAGVSESSVDVFDVHSDGEFLFMYTRVVFSTLGDAEEFLDILLSDPEQVLPSEIVDVEPGTTKLLRPGQAPPTIQFPVPWADYAEEKLPDSQLAAKPAESFDAFPPLPDSASVTSKPSSDPVDGPNLPLPVWLIAALAAVIGGSVILVVISFIAYRQARRNGSTAAGAGDLPTMMIGNGEFEPVDVQCIDTAITSRQPTQDNDLRPPNPPFAPPAGMGVGGLTACI
jgi:hypothetical protein